MGVILGLIVGLGIVGLAIYTKIYNRGTASEDMINQNSKSGSTILLIVGIIWVAIMLGVMWANTSEEASKLFALIIGFLIAASFIAVGIWLGIVEPIRRKNDMSDCHIVTGEITDFVEQRDSDNDTVYFPIYTYEKYGDPVSFRASSGGNTQKYRQIGRKVRIVINDRTGEVYAQEDSNSVRNAALLFLVLGIGIAILICYLYGTGQFSTQQASTQEHYRNSSEQEDENKMTADECNIRYEDLTLDETQAYLEYYYHPDDTGKVYSYNIKIYEGGGAILLFPHEKQEGKSFHQSILFDTGKTDEGALDSTVTDTEHIEENVAEYLKTEAELSTGTRYLYYYDGSSKSEIGNSGSTIKEAPTFYYSEMLLRKSIPQAVWDAMDAEMQAYYE